MQDTSLSFLDQLRRSEQSVSWSRLVDLYGPLLHKWLKRYEVQSNDADDLVQEVLLAVSEQIGDFEHRGYAGGFRGWLKAILLNRLRKYWRTRDRKPPGTGGTDVLLQLAALEDPTSGASKQWDEQHDRFVLQRLLQIVRAQVSDSQWEAFFRVALRGQKPASVAEDLQMSLNSVCLAKSRVLRRLRQEAAGLIQSSTDFLPNS